VAGLYGERVAALISTLRPCHTFRFPAGERNKTRETWGALTDAMLRTGLGRDAAVVALGGGVAGDLAGFVAATYMRGLPYVQVPTTLLAMIDSAIGGKTGVDTTAGKNLVGAFHQPRSVVVDLAVLDSLPDRELAAGTAEAIKHGLVADARYFDELSQQSAAIRGRERGPLLDAVRRSIEIKGEIVSADEREAGARAALNAGHTIAHAIEAAAEFDALHGEAVAMGLVAETSVAERLGIAVPGTTNRLKEALLRYDLPTGLPPGFEPSQLAAPARIDKKNRGGRLRLALVEEIGKMARTKTGDWTFHIAEEDLINSLKEVMLST
jgi:3-dehydroquinate synthase